MQADEYNQETWREEFANCSAAALLRGKWPSPQWLQSFLRVIFSPRSSLSVLDSSPVSWLNSSQIPYVQESWPHSSVSLLSQSKNHILLDVSVDPSNFTQGQLFFMGWNTLQHWRTGHEQSPASVWIPIHPLQVWTAIKWGVKFYAPWADLTWHEAHTQ